MKSLLTTAVACAAFFALGGSAVAQDRDAGMERGDPAMAEHAPMARDADMWMGAPAGVSERIEWLEHRINRAIDRRTIGRREAEHAIGDLRSIRAEVATMRMRDGGTLNAVDRAYIQDRLDRLSRGLHWAARRHDDD